MNTEPHDLFADIGRAIASAARHRPGVDSRLGKRHWNPGADSCGFRLSQARAAPLDGCAFKSAEYPESVEIEALDYRVAVENERVGIYAESELVDGTKRFRTKAIKGA